MTDNYNAVPVRMKPQVKLAEADEPLSMGRALTGDKYASVIAPVAAPEEAKPVVEAATSSKPTETPVVNKPAVPVKPRPSLRVPTMPETGKVTPTVPTKPVVPAKTEEPKVEVSTLEKKGRMSMWNWNLQVRRMAMPKEAKAERAKINEVELKEDGKKFVWWSVGLFAGGLVFSIIPLLLNGLMSAWWLLLTIPVGLLVVITSSIVSGVGILNHFWKRIKHRWL